MKLIIIEGPDNTGKSTVVKRLYTLLTEFGNVNPTHILTIHNVRPEGKTIKQQIKNIDEYNENLIDNLIDASYTNAYDYIIIDRAWLSEYVYGQLYRNRTKENSTKVLLEHERTLSLRFKDFTDNVWLVMLNSDNAEFLLKHEDGNSLSMNTEEPIDMMEKEIQYFNDAFDLAICNKTKVIVNNDEGTDFKSFDDVINEICKGLF